MSYIAKVMNTKEGRGFVNELLDFCGNYRSAEGDLHDILRKEGKRQVGLYVLGLIQETNRAQLYLMQEEAYLASKEKENEQRQFERRSSEDHNTGERVNVHEYFNGSSEDGSHDSGSGLNL